jgi:hypothetical protein
MIEMKSKFILPDDPKQKLDIHQESLEQVKLVQKEVLNQKIQVNQEIIGLRLRQIQEKIELRTELSACKKKELNIRMAELALEKQRKSLEEDILSLS